MKNMAHAILIEGGNPESRMAKALDLLCEFFEDDPLAEFKIRKGIYEDLIFIDREEGKEIRVGVIVEQLIPFFKQKPFAGTGRACIIPRGDDINKPAQNKLLKLLEEPAAGYVIIILAANAERLYATVRSRCIRLWLGYDVQEQGPISDDVKELARALIFGKGVFADTCGILSRYEGSREEAAEFLNAFILFLRGLAVGGYSPELISGDSESLVKIKEAAEKVKPAQAELIRKCISGAEKALNGIGRGYRIRYELRGMALSMRVSAGAGGYR